MRGRSIELDSTRFADHSSALPPLLSTLQLPLCELMDPSLPHLPSSLKELTVAAVELKGSFSRHSLQYLPRKLRDLTILTPLKDVYPVHIESLPPTLTRFSCKNLTVNDKAVAGKISRDCLVISDCEPLMLALNGVKMECVANVHLSVDPRVLRGEITW